MAQDLLILKLLKIPVLVIKLLAKSFAILTYLPNYIVFLILDTIIFSYSLTKTSAMYILTWVLRLACLISVILIFCGQFYGMYLAMKIQHLYWVYQVLIMVVVLQICIALMRKGYLMMIQKFNPTKLKSPYEHAEQFIIVFSDIICLILIVINTVLLINIAGTFSYRYKYDSKFGFFKHLLKQTKISILRLIKLFYVKIFFRIFSWRYEKSLVEIARQEQLANVLNLSVLLTLLFLATLFDIIFITFFGVYCYYLHPKNKLAWQKNKNQHRRYRVVLWFLGNSTVEIWEIISAMFCLPLKYRQSITLLKLILNNKDYNKNYVPETFFVMKLAALKVPSLLCQLLVIISIYKYKKMKILLLQAQKIYDQKSKNKIVNERAVSLSSTEKQYSREYISFRCFGSLLTEIPLFGFIAVNCVFKPHNIGWLGYLLTEKYDIRSQLVFNYFRKNITDYFMFIPALLPTILVSIYDPIKAYRNLKIVKNQRSLLKLQIASIYFKQHDDNLQDANYQQMFRRKTRFYSTQAAVMPKVALCHSQQIKKDIFLIPMFLLAKLSLLSLMKCPHPQNSVQIIQFLLMLFYIRRVQKYPGSFQLFTQILKKDEAAGLIKTTRHRLRFWKFAHKACRHHTISKILSYLMPNKMADRAIVNAHLQKNYSAISNYYWHRYNITIALINAELYFIISSLIALFGLIILMPLTLWRMPTFFILFRKMQYSKNSFFPILFKMYKQMFFDIIQILFKLFMFVVCPISMFRFYRKNIFQYGHANQNKAELSQILSNFEKVQKLKIEYIGKTLTYKAFITYQLLWKICLVKLLWVRKRDMNLELTNKNIKIHQFIKQAIKTYQYIPSVTQLLDKGVSFSNFNNKPIAAELRTIVNRNFQIAIQDIPYLSVTLLVFVTLPWRLFYIKQALILMRQDKIHRRECMRLLKKVSQDYKCICLYIILLLSIVRTRRTLYLIKRNIKLNFYVGFLKYSHINELKNQLFEVVKFYRSLGILSFAMILAPLRLKQILSRLYRLYKVYRQQQNEKLQQQQMHKNTVKAGKQQQILSLIGHQVLLNVFQYLDTKQLARMSSVSRYMYDVVRERDQSWMEHWQRVYQAQYEHSVIENNQYGEPLYYNMCRKAFQLENSKAGAQPKEKNRFYALALQQFHISCFSQHTDLKLIAQTKLSPSTFNKIFTSLRYNAGDGYGPQSQWPLPDDNIEYLNLMNIQRRQIVELDQQATLKSWLIDRPVQFFIVRLGRFYNANSQRKAKQTLFYVTYPIIHLWRIIYLVIWQWFWDFTPLIGLKIIFVIYLTIYMQTLFQRYKAQSRNWVSLNPFDITEDIKNIMRRIKISMQQQSTKAKIFLEDKIIKPYIFRPIKWFFTKIGEFFRYIFTQLKRLYTFLVDKVVYPLYISISNKIRMVWFALKKIYNLALNSVKFIIDLIGKILLSGFKVLQIIASGISRFYSSILENSLKLALSFGVVGELIFTIIALVLMFSPSIICYYYFFQRWFIILSTLFTMILIITGYKHLTRIKNEVLSNKK